MIIRNHASKLFSLVYKSEDRRPKTEAGLS